jgi:hypothetical protein
MDPGRDLSFPNITKLAFRHAGHPARRDARAGIKLCPTALPRRRGCRDPLRGLISMLRPAAPNLTGIRKPQELLAYAAATLCRRQGRQQRRQLCAQRQQSNQVKDEFNCQPTRSQSNSSRLVIGHSETPLCLAPLEFQTKHNASSSAVTAITARAAKRAARKPPVACVWKPYAARLATLAIVVRLQPNAP